MVIGIAQIGRRATDRNERTPFWFHFIVRKRIHVSLREGDRLLRKRSFENQRYRASGLSLVVAAIVLWNTVYLGRAVHGLREQGKSVDEYLLAHLSPLGWEHINLTGDYVWHSNKRVSCTDAYLYRLILDDDPDFANKIAKGSTGIHFSKRFPSFLRTRRGAGAPSRYCCRTTTSD